MLGRKSGINRLVDSRFPPIKSGVTRTVIMLFFERMSPDDPEVFGPAVEEVVYLAGGPVKDGYRETVSLDVQDEVFAHDRQTNQTDSGFLHCIAPQNRQRARAGWATMNSHGIEDALEYAF